MHFLVLRRSVLTPIQWSQPCSSVTSLLQFRNNFDYTCIQTHIVQQWPHTVNPTLKTFPLTSVSVTSAARCVSRENTPHKRHQVAEKTGSQRWEVNCDSQRHSWYDTHTHTHRGGKKRGPWFGSFGWWLLILQTVCLSVSPTHNPWVYISVSPSLLIPGMFFLPLS